MKRVRVAENAIVGPLAALVIVFAIASITTPRFLQIQNLVNDFLQVSVISIVAIGATMVILTGGIDLSPGSIIALLTMLFATLMKKLSFPMVWSILIVIALGAILGTVNGLLTAYLRIPAFVSTLATMSIYRGIAFLFNNASPIFSISESIAAYFYGNVLGVPLVVIYIVLFYALAHVFLIHTEKGRQMYAVGGNTSSAIYSGIDVKLISMLAFIIAGVMAAVGAVLLSARLNSGSPNYGAGMELQAIAAAAIGGASLSSGGKANIICTFFGAAIVVIVNNVLNLHSVITPYQSITVGIIVILAVLLDVWRGKIAFMFSSLFSHNVSKRDRS
jgi:ribose transport system permease protein